jgi:hypothetical protein
VRCDFACKVLFGALVADEIAELGDDSSQMHDGYCSFASSALIRMGIHFTWHSSEHNCHLDVKWKPQAQIPGAGIPRPGTYVNWYRIDLPGAGGMKGEIKAG